MATEISEKHLSKKAYGAEVDDLREQLIQLQVKLKDAPFNVLLILAGVEGAGRSELINTLTGWLDPRGVETFAYREPTDVDRRHPLMWRFWNALPTRGRIGIYVSSWYTEAIHDHAHDKGHFRDIDHEIERIRHFEKLLVDDGTLVIKVWLHMSRAEQGRRLKELASSERTAWRVTPDHWHAHRHYARLARLSKAVIERTNQPGAQWTILDLPQERARNVTTAKLLLQRFNAHLRRITAKRKTRPKPENPPKALRVNGVKELRKVEVDRILTADEYEERREKWLGRLSQSVRRACEAKRAIAFVFEGWDAAGKGGAIRRLTSAIDARDYRVVPIAKPTDEELAHHYLWRFWRQLPHDGYVTVFDRSWYGRVLVERLEGFARPDEWKRAYREINDFEHQLTEHGIIVVKFWLQIGKEEQLKRFRARENTRYKQHKINAEDWRNRAKWDAYEVAVGDMLQLTDEHPSKWHVIPANNKRFARLEILKTACKQIDDALKETP